MPCPMGESQTPELSLSLRRHSGGLPLDHLSDRVLLGLETATLIGARLRGVREEEDRDLGLTSRPELRRSIRWDVRPQSGNGLSHSRKPGGLMPHIAGPRDLDRSWAMVASMDDQLRYSAPQVRAKLNLEALFHERLLVHDSLFHSNVGLAQVLIESDFAFCTSGILAPILRARTRTKSGFRAVDTLEDVHDAFLEIGMYDGVLSLDVETGTNRSKPARCLRLPSQSRRCIFYREGESRSESATDLDLQRLGDQRFHIGEGASQRAAPAGAMGLGGRNG